MQVLLVIIIITLLVCCNPTVILTRQSTDMALMVKRKIVNLKVKAHSMIMDLEFTTLDWANS